MTTAAWKGAAPPRASTTGFVPRRLENLIAQQLLRPCFLRHREMLLLAGFDARNRLIGMEIAPGASDRCHDVSPQWWRAAARCGVVHAVMAHNHPSNIAQPSAADRRWTGEVTRILANFGVELSDHLIFTARGHYSFQRAGLL